LKTRANKRKTPDFLYYSLLLALGIKEHGRWKMYFILRKSIFDNTVIHLINKITPLFYNGKQVAIKERPLILCIIA
jgi:hypothetical protein